MDGGPPAGIPPPEDESRWALATEALKGVWASKYNDRAYYSLRKAGLDFDSVRMAVLVQRVVPAQYAFVIHTRNPSNNDETEVFCEMVKGLGEYRQHYHHHCKVHCNVISVRCVPLGP